MMCTYQYYGIISGTKGRTSTKVQVQVQVYTLPPYGWHQECTRIAPGVHQDRTRIAPGVIQECTKSAPRVHQECSRISYDAASHWPGTQVLHILKSEFRFTNLSFELFLTLLKYKKPQQYVAFNIIFTLTVCHAPIKTTSPHHLPPRFRLSQENQIVHTRWWSKL